MCEPQAEALRCSHTAALWEAERDAKPRQVVDFPNAPLIWSGPVGQPCSPPGLQFACGWMEVHGLDVHQVLFQHIVTIMLEVSLSWCAWGYAWPYPSCWVEVQGSGGGQLNRSLTSALRSAPGRAAVT